MKFILFRHGHSLANQESRIVSSLEHGTKTNGGPLGTGFGLSDKGKQEVRLVSNLAFFCIQSPSSKNKRISNPNLNVSFPLLSINTITFLVRHLSCRSYQVILDLQQNANTGQDPDLAIQTYPRDSQHHSRHPPDKPGYAYTLTSAGSGPP